MKLEVPENFEDVVVEFSREEWDLLSDQEKELHREVMVQNYESMVSLGYNIPMKYLLLLIGKDNEVQCDHREGGQKLLQKELHLHGTDMLSPPSSSSTT
ncbi:putative zinc finger protein 705B isoform X2 [Protopterus annectens]|uniref:putative zinc finger protein 705B isoform X2 n=1 Tax=Protopterus annectens TaxID=7888 RepID=UPI001CF9B7D6|nr:putative zinc finger protein 705B isoform X2 [Protopterus annectens]